MPDINLDSLFIIGLILASLIGKIFKKGDPEEKQRGKEKKEPSETEDRPDVVNKEAIA